MREIPNVDADRGAGFGFCTETGQIAAAMTETPGDLDTLDALVKALKTSGIWGRLGEISWARDITQSGLLIEWIPREQRAYAALATPR